MKFVVLHRIFLTLHWDMSTPDMVGIGERDGTLDLKELYVRLAPNFSHIFTSKMEDYLTFHGHI